MVTFPNCKINIGLHILQKRNDGFHNLETFFYPVPLHDVLEITESNKLSFHTTGIKIPQSGSNICERAYLLIKEDFPHVPPVKIHLHKVIPIGAGLGGGSSDGAFMLRLLNDTFDLNISTEKLLEYALRLGSDCPIFILNRPAFAQGRGEILAPTTLSLSGYFLIIINPGIHINTKSLFQLITPGSPHMSIQKMIDKPMEEWKNGLTNDFEAPVFKMYPLIEKLRNLLYDKGATYAAMSGTGSSVFGFFKKNMNPSFDIDPTFFIKKFPLP